MTGVERYYLVPKTEFDRISNVSNNSNNSITKQAEHGAGKDIEEILNTKTETDVHSVARKYAQLLERYLQLIKQNQNDTIKFTLTDPNPKPSPSPSPIPTVKAYTGKRQRNAKQILNHMSDVGMSYNDRDQLVINDVPVKNTSIADLIASATYTRSVKPEDRPPGFEIFLNTLAASSISDTYFPNKAVKDKLIELRSKHDDDDAGEDYYEAEGAGPHNTESDGSSDGQDLVYSLSNRMRRPRGAGGKTPRIAAPKKALSDILSSFRETRGLRKSAAPYPPVKSIRSRRNLDIGEEEAWEQY